MPNTARDASPDSTGSDSLLSSAASVATTTSSTDDDVYDLICIGFGPAALAIALAIADSAPANFRALFLEKQAAFAWHAGMLLPAAKMQIGFIKDLAMLRDPTSRFTFVNYLHAHGRLIDFANMGTFYPYREEFEAYLRWCAGQVDDMVAYGEQVVGVAAPERGGHVGEFEVESRVGGAARVRRGRNVVVSTGGSPAVPAVFAPAADSPRLMHSSAYMHAIHARLPERDAAYRVAVVGAGQSAAEIFADLHSRFPNAHTDLVIRDRALRPSDDSPFVNEIFNPDAVDHVYYMDPAARAAAIARDRATNYSVVRIDLLDKLYSDLYLQKLPGHVRQHAIRAQTTVDAVAVADRVHLHLRDTLTGEVADEAYDLVVVATGYDRNQHERLLKPMAHLLAGSAAAVSRDYRLPLHPKVPGGVWLQGCCEATHGLSDSLLSTLAIRSQDVLNSILAAR
ncbi:L-ornithine N5-oxygenase sida [Dipodascopsis tothii]|uniref:L-ornithine N5-oxygenase sida n=1 Tax=Dipodascopsis tothii TaxID=44089 RepID=UPI0034CDBBE3